MEDNIKTLDKIVLKDGNTIDIIRFIEYGDDKKMFAIHNDDLYINHSVGGLPK